MHERELDREVDAAIKELAERLVEGLEPAITGAGRRALDEIKSDLAERRRTLDSNLRISIETFSKEIRARLATAVSEFAKADLLPALLHDQERTAQAAHDRFAHLHENLTALTQAGEAAVTRIEAVVSAATQASDAALHTDISNARAIVIQALEACEDSLRLTLDRRFEAYQRLFWRQTLALVAVCAVIVGLLLMLLARR